MTSFTARGNVANLRKYSDNFGVSPENFVASFADVGVEGLTIAQEGLLVAAKAAKRGNYYIMKPEDLIKGAYADVRSDIGDSAAAEQYMVSEWVEQYCQGRGISPATVARIGGNLLTFAANAKVSTAKNAGAFKPNVNGGLGKLDSVLEFRVTSMNTISMHRKRPNPMARAIKSRLKYI